MDLSQISTLSLIEKKKILDEIFRDEKRCNLIELLVGHTNSIKYTEFNGRNYNVEEEEVEEEEEEEGLFEEPEEDDLFNESFKEIQRENTECIISYARCINLYEKSKKEQESKIKLIERDIKKSEGQTKNDLYHERRICIKQIKHIEECIEETKTKISDLHSDIEKKKKYYMFVKDYFIKRCEENIIEIKEDIKIIENTNSFSKEKKEFLATELKGLKDRMDNYSKKIKILKNDLEFLKTIV